MAIMEILLEHASIMLIAECAIFCAIFILGVFLQFKMISTLKRDQATAWEINLMHSIVMIVHWSFRIFLEAIQYIEPDYYAFFGKWFCYCLLAIVSFGVFEMALHSLYISIHKYIFIVQSETANRFGECKTKRLLQWAYFILLITWSISYTIRGNFIEFGITSRCGLPSVKMTDDKLSIEEPIETPNTHTFTCGIDDLDPKKVNIIENFMKKILCPTQNIITFLLSLNVFEIFFYLSIFRHMNR